MPNLDSERILEELERFIEEAVAWNGGDTSPVKPDHRVLFHWPPHSISAEFHVRTTDWTETATCEADGEELEVQVARTPHGVFVRSLRYWNEARKPTLEEALDALVVGLEPLFRRQRAIAQTLGYDGRYSGKVDDLPPSALVKLLYCPDRDVTHEARVAIETHASQGAFTPALIRILRDDRHPQRRSAQWAVLDMFEDLPSFCHTAAQQLDAVTAIRDLMWSAPDDYARTIYKAGVVLGGHIVTQPAAEALMACIAAPSRIGRRSAIHAVLHLVEWMPHYRDEVLDRLRRQRQVEPEPLLAEFTECQVRDIAAGNLDHVTEPTFPDEP